MPNTPGYTQNTIRYNPVEYIAIQGNALPNTRSGYNGYNGYNTIQCKYDEIQIPAALRNTVRRTHRHRYGIPRIPTKPSYTTEIPSNTHIRITSEYNETHFQIRVRDTVHTVQYLLCASRYTLNTRSGQKHISTMEIHQIQL